MVTVVLYKTQKFGRVKVTAREEKVGYFALKPKEKEISYHVDISRLRCQLWLLHIKHNVTCRVRTRRLSKLVYYKFMCKNK